MHLSKLTILTLLVAPFCALSGCKNNNADLTSHQYADHLATTKNFKKSLIKTKPFHFTTYQKTENLKSTKHSSKTNRSVSIYIEGDGRSVIPRLSGGTKPSPDPTPLNPLALKLAFLDPSPTVVYLARPCQYTPHSLDSACTAEMWSTLRFSEIVIDAMNQAVEKIKIETKAQEIHLIGFSGGAAIATLIAARRQDIASIRTIAGDLDHVQLSAYHKTTPLQGSLNPKSIAKKIAHIPQHHFVGSLDKIVPPFISAEFVDTISKTGSQCAKRTVVQNFEHHIGWEQAWQTLLSVPVNCR